MGATCPPGYDDPVSDATPTPTSDAAPTAPSPGERRLAHPPSDRYRAAAAASPTAETLDPAASVPRGIAIAATVALLGALAIVLLGGVMTVTIGLVIVAGTTGWGVATGLRFGAGGQLQPRRRVVAAVALAVGSVALAQLGLWQYARSEGGVLPPLEYLAEVFGLVVPLQFGAAAVVAWLVAR